MEEKIEAALDKIEEAVHEFATQNGLTIIDMSTPEKREAFFSWMQETGKQYRAFKATITEQEWNLFADGDGTMLARFRAFCEENH